MRGTYAATFVAIGALVIGCKSEEERAQEAYLAKHCPYSSDYAGCVKYTKAREQTIAAGESPCAACAREQQACLRTDPRRPLRLIPEPGDDDIIKTIERDCDRDYGACKMKAGCK